MPGVIKLPPNGPERERLREKGQFWTPSWVAEAMVAYAVSNGCRSIFDPAVGEGAFFRAAKLLASELGTPLTLRGTEVDAEALHAARRAGLSESDLSSVEVRDFVLDPPIGSFEAIIANPPYIRHHRLSQEVKGKLKAFGASTVGQPLDGRAGYHIYFLLRALQLLEENGRLAFIMPADTCEGVYAPVLWQWITRHYRLEAVITFHAQASPFPAVDTNPIIYMIRRCEPSDRFLWASCAEAGTRYLKSWVVSNFTEHPPQSALTVCKRDLKEGLATGLSRPPAEEESGGVTLLDYAEVRRGIATGANEFFFLTVGQARHLGIPEDFLIPAIGRTRDVQGDVITDETVRSLEQKGRPTLLFSPDGRPLSDFPLRVRSYLEQGQAQGLDRRPLIAQRKPWYKMERRDPPPILFAYLGRRNARLIRNYAGVVPLTCFLCVYPLSPDPSFVEKLWRVLRHPLTLANLPRVSKSYGGGALKAEPRGLERLPLLATVIAEVGLEMPDTVEQPQLELALSL